MIIELENTSAGKKLQADEQFSCKAGFVYVRSETATVRKAAQP
jgi:hypothetical protein